MSDYAELHCLSNFSFQRGASSAHELFERAARLGYRALAITDECTLAGIVRAWQASKAAGVPLIVGSEVRVEQGPKLVLLAENLAGYQALCRLITRARRRSEKGSYRLLSSDFSEPLDGLLALWLGEHQLAHADWLQAHFPGRSWLGIALHRGADDAERLRQALALAARCGLPPVACGDVHMHARGRRALQDCMTAIRHHLPVAEAGAHLFANGERHLRRRQELAELYPAELLAETLRISERCRFDLAQLRYEYPRELVPNGYDATSWLRRLTEQGARWRWPDGVPAIARERIEHELSLIAELRYESYFLTVHDIVRWAREQGILCQGRGSAANSTVCFALGITELDPSRSKLLFERFLSRERNEPPDIDVDFEHERREAVIQYVFGRYGRGRAALTAVVSSYHAAGAVRDVAKALGLPPDQVNALADCCGRWSDGIPCAERLAEAGFDADNPLLRRVLALSAELIGFPRHLSQHPGGFVISEQPLETLVPVENASMAERTVIQWDKDDLDQVGLLKVDVLALGMLSALRRCFALIEAYRGTRWTLASLPQEDPATYAMVSRADTIGVFQIESRAQMAMLPRLQPRTFYDLVIQVAIVRPGPIQGDMVHPYLRRRNREEPVDYPSEELRPVLERTLGVPLFQEQVIKLAMVAAGFSPGEADQLRRSMAAWKRHGGLDHFRERLLDGMRARGYEQHFAERLFNQIQGFGEYGFPESHAASFALLAYVSAWLKCHEPAAFAAGLLNSQPMGFYAPAQLLQDLRRHGVEVRPIDVGTSHWDCTLEPTAKPGGPALRLGFCLVKGLAAAVVERLVTARGQGAFVDTQDLAHRATLTRADLRLLAEAGALAGLAGHRHRAHWSALGREAPLALLPEPRFNEAAPLLRKPRAGEDVLADYGRLGFTLGAHPLELLRPALDRLRCQTVFEVLQARHGQRLRTAGLVVMRQRPGTATGVVFVTLEDETGTLNLIVWSSLVEAQRKELLGSRLLGVVGKVQREGPVVHFIAERLEDHGALLGRLPTASRDFH